MVSNNTYAVNNSYDFVDKLEYVSPFPLNLNHYSLIFLFKRYLIKAGLRKGYRNLIKLLLNFLENLNLDHVIHYEIV